jgi:MATE family multidrug resistance protein
MESAVTNNNLKVEINNRQILSIALPITLAILIPQINLLTNSMFLGHLGTDALGNAGITGVFYLIFAVAGHGFNNALQTVFSKYAGSGQPDFFKIIFSQGLRIALQFALVGIAFTWLIAPFIMQEVADPRHYDAEMNFLKIRILGLPFLYVFQLGNAFLVASLNSRYLMIAFLFETLVNVLLDYLLIFGNWGFPEMGFNGAAWASVIAECTGMLVIIAVLRFTGLQKKYALPGNLRFNKIFNQEIIRVALPLVAQYMISVTTWLVFFLLIEGRGTEAKAISNVMRNVFGIAGVFVWAFASTTSSMVSNLMGQQRENDVLALVKRISLWSIGLCFIMVGTLNLYPSLFFKLFGQSNAFIDEGIPVIRVVSLGLLLMSVANIWLNAVTGTGKTKVNLLIELAAITLYLIYTYYFMKVNYVSLSVAWSNEFVYWSAIFIMSSLYIFSKKWQKKNNQK